MCQRLAAAMCFLFVTWAQPSGAVIIADLSFDSLPSAQGWEYFSLAGIPESSVWSVDGTTLTRNTIGLGLGDSGYILRDALNPNLPVTVRLRARVSVSEGGLTGFSAGPDLGMEAAVMFLTEDTILWGLQFPLVLVPFDNTVFHDYRIEFNAGVEALLFVDDSLVAGGIQATANPPDANLVAFGDFTRTDPIQSGPSNAHVEITQLTITQVPEPSTALLLATGLASLAVQRRRSSA